MNGEFDHFLKWVFWVGFIALILMVGGIFFGPWEIDEKTGTLLLVISNPTSGAFAALMTRAGVPQ